jgi:hypothetical protein
MIRIPTPPLALALPLINRLRWLGWCLLPTLLALPWLAMQFSDQVRWSGSDFVVAGILLGGCAGLLELALWRAPSLAYVLAALLAVGAGLLQVWANLAVGIVGSEANPQNLRFLVVVGCALLAALFSAGRPQRLAVGMRLTALAQLGVALWFALEGVLLPVFTVILTGLWLAAAALFRRAGG